MNWQGNWSPEQEYAKDDVVHYLGSSYICLAASYGRLPTNPLFWALQAQKGDKGEPGQSIVGPKGDKGDTVIGPAGPAGESIIGPKGDKGDKGDTGLSAYEIALENGFKGTEQEFLDALRGPPGPAGRSARNGAAVDISNLVPYTGATADLDMGGTYKVITHTVTAHGSDGLLIESNSGTDAMLIGAGGGANVTFYDGVKLDAKTASRVLTTDSSKNIATSSVTDTELGYLSGVTSSIQTQIDLRLKKPGATRFGWFAPLGNGNTVYNVGVGNAVTGTAGTSNVTNASEFMSLPRVIISSSGAAGSSCGTRNGALQFYLGDAAGRGGFEYYATWGVGDNRANQRLFQGMWGTSTAIGNVDPSTLTDMFGFGCDSGQTNLRFFHNDAAGTATTIDLGVNFPTNTDRTDMYLTRIYAAPNASSISYYIKNIVTGAEASGTVNSNLPSQSTLLSPQIWMNNGTTALAVSIHVVGWTIEVQL